MLPRPGFGQRQLWIGTTLAALLVVTRSQHMLGVQLLPWASWAVFLLAGVYLRSAWVPAGLLTLAFGVDMLAVTWGGVSGFCVTPAYSFLLPAYGALWLAGRWYARQHRWQWRTLLPLAGAVLAGTTLCELFSSGGFYFFSGQFAAPTIAGFVARLARYLPGDLGSVAVYVALAGALQALWALGASHRPRDVTTP